MVVGCKTGKCRKTGGHTGYEMKIVRIIKKNDFIIDKTFNVEKYGSSSVSYIYHDFKLKTNHFQTTHVMSLTIPTLQ